MKPSRLVTSGGVRRHTVRGMRKITKAALVGGAAAAAIAATVGVASPARPIAGTHTPTPSSRGAARIASSIPARRTAIPTCWAMAIPACTARRRLGPGPLLRPVDRRRPDHGQCRLDLLHDHRRRALLLLRLRQSRRRHRCQLFADGELVGTRKVLAGLTGAAAIAAAAVGGIALVAPAQAQWRCLDHLHGDVDREGLHWLNYPDLDNRYFTDYGTICGGVVACDLLGLDRPVRRGPIRSWVRPAVSRAR